MLWECEGEGASEAEAKAREGRLTVRGEFALKSVARGLEALLCARIKDGDGDDNNETLMLGRAKEDAQERRISKCEMPMSKLTQSDWYKVLKTAV